MNKTKVKSIGMASVYAEDYEVSFKFYNGLLGLDNIIPMGNNACFFRLPGEQGIYLAGGYKLPAGENDKVRTTFTLDVDSAFEMYDKLSGSGIKIIQDKPVEMGENMFWFQCYDPSGNIVEFLGGE